MTDDTETIALDKIERLAFAALCRAGTDPANARPVAASVAAAEAQGLASHGLLRLPTYCDHVACGKVDGRARPVLSQPRPGVAVVDAATGFAHPAIDLGLPVVAEAARRNGIALLGITNSYYCGVVGDHVERLAREGLVALGFVNAPASIAPWGGITPLFGTNPIAFAFPVAGADPIVIDQSSSVVARGEIMLRAKMGANLPEGWALDADGRPTNDAAAALRGRLMPAGGHKWAGQALMVEILAAALIGAQFGFEASSFATMEGGPPRTGQSFIAIDPDCLGSGFASRVGALIGAMLWQQGVRVPGARRLPPGRPRARAVFGSHAPRSTTCAGVPMHELRPPLRRLRRVTDANRPPPGDRCRGMSVPSRHDRRRGRLRLQPRKCFGEISERSVQAGGNCSQEDQSSPCRAVADIRPRVPLSLEIRGLLPCSGRSALGEESVRRVHASERASEVRGTAGRSRRAENVLSRPSSCGFPEG